MNKKIKGKILAVCQSREKGTVKKDIGSGVLVENCGLENDAHAGKWHRQISLLGIESINKKCHHNCEIRKKNWGLCNAQRRNIYPSLKRR